MKLRHTTNRLVRSGDQGGWSMVTVLVSIVTLTMIFIPVMSRTRSTYRQVNHIASWQESLVAAEAGADRGMAALRQSLTDPTRAFFGWKTTAADGTPLPDAGRQLTLPTITHAGEGNNQLDVRVTLDSPTSFRDGSDRQWYRIRSVGTTYLPGGPVIT